MIKSVAAAIITGLVSFHALAEQRISVEQIQQVIEATDAAAMRRDTRAIGAHLSENFAKQVDIPIPERGWNGSVTLDKQQYLDLIEQSWQNLEQYSYRRENTVINIAADGRSGESSSTITETVVIAGESRVSKVREYAQYALENGRAVITSIGGHTLVGDTMPDGSR